MISKVPICTSIEGSSSSCGSSGYYIAYYDATKNCLLPVPGKPLHCADCYKPVPCNPTDAVAKFGKGFTGVAGQCYIICCIPESTSSSN